MLVEGKKNRSMLGLSGDDTVQLGADGELLVAQARTKYGAIARSGRLWTVSDINASGTGLGPGTTIATTSPFALWNAAGNNYNMEVLDISVGYVSGTIGAGSMYLAFESSPVPTAPNGTGVYAVNALGGSTNSAPYSGFISLSSLNGAPSVVCPIFNLGAITAATTLGPYSATCAIDGKIVLTPGSLLRVCSIAAAGSSPLIHISATFATVDR